MRKLIFLVIIISLLFISAFFISYRISWNLKESKTKTLTPTLTPRNIINTDEMIVSQIANALAEKYQRKSSVFIVTISAKNTTHAYGQVHFKDEFGGAIWHGALSNGKWILIADGQGPMSCDLAEKFVFPTSMVPGCINTKDGNKFIQRSNPEQ